MTHQWIDCRIHANKPTLGMLLVLSLATLLFALTQCLLDPAPSMNWSMPISWVLVAWLVTFFTLTSLAFHSPYLYTNGYILVLVVFHLGLFFQHALGVEIKLDHRFGNMSGWVEQAGWYTLLALCAFSVGFCTQSLCVQPKWIPAATLLNRKRFTQRIAKLSAMGLFCASGLFFLWMVKSYGNILGYTRAEIFSANVDSRGLGVFMMIFPGAVLLYFFSAQTKREKWLATALCFGALMFFLISGYRSAALFPALVGVITWVKLGRRIPLPLAIGLVVSVLLAISAFGHLRTEGPYDQLSAQKLATSYEQASVASSITGMGKSVMAAAYTLKLVPEKSEYRKGRTYFYALMGGIPNIGFDLSTDRSRETLAKRMASGDKTAALEMSPSDWLTYNVLHSQYKSGGGTGYSGIIEPYLNFGILGVIVFFVIVGALFAVLESRQLTLSPLVFLFTLSVLWMFYRTARDDIANFTKPLGFTLIILSIWWIFLKCKGVRKGVKENQAIKWDQVERGQV